MLGLSRLPKRCDQISAFWIDDQYTLLEQKLTDRYIWFFKKLRGIMVGRMGQWKKWACCESAIIIAKHSAVENIKVPEPSVNTAIKDASDVETLRGSQLTFIKDFLFHLDTTLYLLKT